MPYLVVPHMRSLLRVFTLVLFINPRRGHAARVTVLGLSVYLSVYATLVVQCPMPHWLHACPIGCTIHGLLSVMISVAFRDK